MKTRLPFILAILLAFFAGSASAGVGRSADIRIKGSHPAPAGLVLMSDHALLKPVKGTPHNPHFSCHTTGPKAGHKEKRHGKSLVSPDIVANFPVPAPKLIYGVRNYAAFHSGEAIQLHLAAFFLRGPPVC